MFERFTDSARRVIVLAQEEARGLGHDYIGAEHLLLGVLAVREEKGGAPLGGLVLAAENGTVEQVLATAGADIDRLREDALTAAVVSTEQRGFPPATSEARLRELETRVDRLTGQVTEMRRRMDEGA